MQVKPLNLGLRNAPHTVFFAPGDELRFRAFEMRNSGDIATVENVGTVEAGEFRPTAIAVVMVPIIAWRLVRGEAEDCSSQVLDASVSPVVSQTHTADHSPRWGHCLNFELLVTMRVRPKCSPDDRFRLSARNQVQYELQSRPR